MLHKGRRATYMRVVAALRTHKADTYRVRCTAGYNLVDYTSPTRTPTSDLTLLKLFLNNAISTPGAKFIDVDLKDFYVNSRLPESEYMLLSSNIFPDVIILQYDIMSKVSKSSRRHICPTSSWSYSL